MMNKVAVYGSLRKNMGNHGFLVNAKHLSTEEIKGFRMYSLGGFPAVLYNGGQNTVTVEVYEVDDDTFESLDMLEGYPRFYDRDEVDTSQGSAWIYYHHTPPSDVIVDSGDWVEFAGKDFY